MHMTAHCNRAGHRSNGKVKIFSGIVASLLLIAVGIWQATYEPRAISQAEA